ncbi:MAG: efflux RND transporter periplasmic adaptor subunit [Leptospiraceae bacterium]|nr:efflux RND transporter periplasmic adaptor subunit [Leptospiraceae bacterium]
MKIVPTSSIKKHKNIILVNYWIFKKKYLRYFKFIIPVFIIILWRIFDFSLNRFFNGNETKEYQSPVIQELVIKEEIINKEIPISGVLEATNIINLNFKTSGRIENFFIKVGTNVKKGKLLAKLETYQVEMELEKLKVLNHSNISKAQLFEQKYKKAKRIFAGRILEKNKQEVNLKKSKAELEKAKLGYLGKDSLFQKGAISQEDLRNTKIELIGKEVSLLNSEKDYELTLVGLKIEDLKEEGYDIDKTPDELYDSFRDLNTKVEKSEWEAAKSQVRISEMNIKEMELTLKESFLHAPIDGYILEKNKEEGEVLNDPKPILKIGNLDKLQFIFYINETDSREIFEKDELKIQNDVYPGKEFSAFIENISPVVDTKSHSVKIEAIIENKKSLLKHGSYARGKIVIKEQERKILIPISSIINEKNDTGFVFKISEDNVLYEKKVKLGKTYKDKITVISGLEEGERVVIGDTSKLKEGMKVELSKK